MLHLNSDRQKILLFRPDHLGDVLLTNPAMHAIRKGFPEAHLSILVASWSAGLLEGNPDPDEVIVCDLPWLDRTPNRSWRPLLSHLRKLRARKFDRIVNFRVAAKSACFSRLCGGRERWGFDLPKSRWAWTHTVSYTPRRHIVDSYMDLARALGAPPMAPRFRIFPDRVDLAPVGGLTEGSPPVVLGVTAGDRDKFWQVDRWAAVADHIAGRGFRVLINGGPSEGDYVDSVLRCVRCEATGLVGRLNLLQFAALLRDSLCLVAVDSFPVHLAVAVDTPVIALFGATSSRQWGPYPNAQPNRVVEPPPHVPRDAKAMLHIEVPHVTEAFDALVADIGTGNRPVLSGRSPA